MQPGRRKTDGDIMFRDILSLMDLMPVGIRWMNRAGECEYLNSTFTRMFGYVLEDIPTIEQWFAQAYPDPEYRSSIAEWYAEKVAALEHGSPPGPLKARITGKDGSVRHVIISAHLTMGRVIGIYTDVTELAKTEDQQREAEKMFRLTFEGARDAIFWADADSGVLINCNREAENLLQTPRSAIIGQHFTCLHPPELLEKITSLFNMVSSVPEPRDDIEAEVITRDGARIPVLIRNSATRIGSQTILQGIFLDISERKKAELDRAALEAQKMMNEEQRQFLGLISHEIRTPLAVIDGAAQLLQMTSTNDVISQAERIRGATQRLSNLIDCCLVDERLATGGWLPKMQQHDITALIDEACGNVRISTQLHTISTATEGLPATFNCDAMLVKVMLANLLDNAVKYSPQGGEITLRATGSDDGAVTIEVSDQGIGIPAEQLEHIFKRFYRTWQISSIAGAGLGLHIVKRIAELHNGDVCCSSAPGHGSTFTVRLRSALNQ